MKSDFNYTINDITISQVKEHNYLGLTLSHDFGWETHIKNITSSALKRLFVLRHRLRLAPSKTKLLAYTILAILEYAIVAWFPRTKTLLCQLEGIQRNAIRFVFNIYKSMESPAELLKQAGLLTIESGGKIARPEH